jgi:peptide/nickel transport system substrate-binding protein
MKHGYSRNNRRSQTLKNLMRLAAVICTLATAAPAAAETVRIGLASLPPMHGNPFGSSARTTWYTLRAYIDALTQLGPGMKPQPALATSWRNTDDNTWVVTLRPNVTFSNGEPLDADAVIASYAYLKSNEAAVEGLVGEVQNIAGLRALDATTVEFKTRAPDPAFPRQMAVIPIVPRLYWQKVGREGFAFAPIGTGSFKVETWDKTRIVLTPFEQSWRAPVAKRIEILALPEQSARIQALLSGRIDIASEIGPDDIELLTSAGFKTYQRPGSSVDAVTFNVLKPNSPFKDVRVRQALNYAVDRAAISKVILHGLVPPATQTASRLNPEYDPSLTGYAYDPAKAKALLKEAGYPNGFSFVFEMSQGTTGSHQPAIMQQIANDLAKVGVRMNIRPIPWPQFVRGVQQGEFQGDSFLFEYETLPTGDTLRAYRLHACDWKHPWYCDQEIMPVLAEAKATFDPARRATLIKQILARTNEQAPAILTFEPLGLDGLSPKVVDYSQENGIIPYAKLTVRP